MRNEQLESIVEGQPNQVLIQSLVVDNDSEPSPFLKRISEQFSECCKGQYQVISFFEKKRSPTVQVRYVSRPVRGKDRTLTKTGPKIFMVTQNSAISTGLTAAGDENNIPLNTDHSGLVKYQSRSQEEYIIVKWKLKILVDEAKQEASRRFTEKGTSLVALPRTCLNVSTNIWFLDLTPEQVRLWDNLNQPPYSSFRSSSKIAEPEKGTLEWLVQEKRADGDSEPRSDSMPQGSLCMKDFESWRDSKESEILLISASPGKGKSVLSNFVLGHLESRMRPELLPPSKVIYYFCNIKNDEASRNANSVLRALIVQLCEDRQRLFRILPSDYEKVSKHFFSASFDTLWHIFERMLRDGTYARVFCVIDGLDVYQEGMNELSTKLNEIFSPRTEAKTPVLKLLCTTRPSTLMLDLPEPPKHRILCCYQGDLDIFIDSRVRSLGETFTDSMRQEIKEQLQKQAGNTFLWLEVVIRRIRSIDMPTPRKIKETIKNSPSDLHSLYDLLVKSIVEKDRDNARLLAWIVYARSPLDLRALQDAMAIDPTKTYTSYEQCDQDKPHLGSEAFHNVFGTLLDIIEDNVYCIHQSVKDYFERQNPLQQFFDGNPRLVLAHVSMAYLSLEEFRQPSWDVKKLLQKFPLFRYAASHWYSHIETAADINCSLPLQDFLKEIIPPNNLKTQVWMSKHVSKMDPDYPSRISEVAIHFDIGWLAELLLNREPCGISDDFERNCLSQAAKHKGAVLEVLLKHEIGLALTVTDAVVRATAEFQHFRMMKLLLDRRGADVQITDKVVEAAAGNGRSGKDIITLLLDRRGADVQITEKAVEVAAGNDWSGKDIITLLLDRRGADVQITEGVIVAAAGNGRSGKDIMTLLLDRRGADVQITEKAVEAAAGNYWSGKDIITLLLDRRGADVQITEKVVQAAAGNYWSGKDIITLLLDRRGADVQITEGVIVAAAGNSRSGKDIITLLLDRKGADVQITEKVVLAAAGNSRSGKDIITLLLDRKGADVQITEKVVLAAARNTYYGEEMMTLILGQQGANVQITEEIVVTAAENDFNGEKMITLLLDRKGADVQITEKVVEAAAGNYWSGKEIITLLLDRRGADVQITDKVIEAAAWNDKSGKEIITLLLDRQGVGIQITEKVVLAAARNTYCGEKMMTLLLDQQGADVQITDKVVEAAAGNGRSGKDIITLLLDRRGADIQITDKVVQAAAGNGRSGKDIITLLLDRRGADVQITEKVVEAAAGNYWSGTDIMRLLLDRRGADVQITKEAVKVIAEHFDQEVITLLLDQQGADIQITEVVEGAAENYRSGKEVIELLLERRRADIQITEKAMVAAARNKYNGKEVVTVLKRREAGVQITETSTETTAEYCGSAKDIMALLLDRQGADAQITEKVVQAAAGNSGSGKDIITLLLDRRGADIQITEKVVQAAAENDRSGKEVVTLLLDRRGADVQIAKEAIKIIAEHFDQGVMTLLLDQQGADVQITDKVVEAAAGNGRSGKDIITLLLDRRGADVQITEGVIVAAAGNSRSGKDIITLLLDRRGADIQITDKVVQAAAGNGRSGKDIITLLLDRRGADVQIAKEAVKVIAEHFDQGVMTLLLDQQGADVQITGEVIEAAAGNDESGAVIC